MVAPEIMAILMFIVTLGFLILGFPVALTLAGSAFIFAFIGSWLGIFHLAILGAYPLRIFGTMVNEPLVAVPLFIFMGVMLERSQLASELLETMGQMFGRIRGGLGLSVIFVGMLLAASTGIVGATVVTMGLLSLPTMLKVGYDPKLSTGLICASGTLGQIIPPSIILILLAEVLQGANEEAAELRGDLAPDPVSGIDLFAGAFIPGLILVGLYASWQIIMAIVKPESCPALNPNNADPLPWKKLLFVAMPPVALIVMVLGSILAGIATPTESAAVGAVGATLLALRNKKLSLKNISYVSRTTTKITSMVFIILIGASMFSLVFRGLGGDELIEKFLGNLPGGALSALFVVLISIFVLGFFLDFIEIILVVVPIVGPVLIALGFNSIWS